MRSSGRNLIWLEAWIARREKQVEHSLQLPGMFDPTVCLPRPAKGEFNDMMHLFVKRFADDDPRLKPGAKKRVPHDATVDYTPRSGSSCKSCRKSIETGSLRVGLMMQCHRGYKCCAYVHGEGDCFWKHRDAPRFFALKEFLGHESLTAADKAVFEKMLKIVGDVKNDTDQKSATEKPIKSKRVKKEDNEVEEEEEGTRKKKKTKSWLNSHYVCPIWCPIHFCWVQGLEVKLEFWFEGRSWTLVRWGSDNEYSSTTFNFDNADGAMNHEWLLPTDQRCDAI